MQKKETFLDNLFNKPVGFIALSYIIVIISVVGIGLYFVKNQNALVLNTIPPVINDSLSVIPEIPVQAPRVASAIDLKTLTAPTPAMLDKGKQTFSTVCATCHGTEGKGDGAAGVALNPKPRNFHAAEGWKNGRKVSELYKTLQFGIPGSGMPPYDYMSPEDRVAVISYIRTFMTAAPADSPSEIAALDATYKLSQGTQLPGTIPVNGAMAMNTNAKLEQAKKIETALGKIKSQSTESAKLFLSVSAVPEQALATVLNDTNALTGADQFRTVVMNGLSRNGFSAKFSLLSSGEISELYTLIKEVLI